MKESERKISAKKYSGKTDIKLGKRQMKRTRKKRMEEGSAKNVANERIKGREGRVTETIRRMREKGKEREDK